MIPKDKIYKLIAIYLYICDLYESELKHICQRFSNNCNPDFTDQEVLTIYLFVMHTEQKIKLNQIHLFAKEYLLSWFPKLPGYEAYNMRINRLSEALKHIANAILNNYCPVDCYFDTSLLDSMPIITCSGKRKGAVAKEITDKGYCSTKNMYYHGIKLHALAYQRPDRLPFPESIVITPASENDLNAFKHNWGNIPNRVFYGDKIYNDTEFFDHVKSDCNSTMLTPVKGVRNQPENIKWTKLQMISSQLRYQEYGNPLKPCSTGL